MNEKHNYYIDIIRIVFAISVFLYHIEVLQGGYLAVCGFFVLTGFFTCKSVQKEDFKLGRHYLGRLERLWIPLAVVVFISLFITLLGTNIPWVAYKRETLSVLFGYNNYWQIAAKTDYFTRAGSSAFTAFWYMGILLQFELLYPLVHLLNTKIFRKKNGPGFFSLFFAVASVGAAIFLSYKLEIGVFYYDTLCRLFSIAIGIALAYMEEDIQNSSFFKKTGTVGFIISGLACIAMTVFVKSTFAPYGLIFVGYTALAAIMLACAIAMPGVGHPEKWRVFWGLGDITYEFYIVSFPVIFLLKNIKPLQARPFYILEACILSVVLSVLLHIVLDERKIKEFYVKVVAVALSFACAAGLVYYVVSPDPQKQLDDLKEQLTEKQEELIISKEEFINDFTSSNKTISEVVDMLVKKSDNVGREVSQMRITCIGDSIMVNAYDALTAKFPNSYIDGEYSRSGVMISEVLDPIIAQGVLGDAVVFNVGINGGLTPDTMQYIMDCIGPDHEVFWVNFPWTLDWELFNDWINEFFTYYNNPNAHLVDWRSYVAERPELLLDDGFHLTEQGAGEYTELIFNEICGVYKQKLKNELVFLSEYDKNHSEEDVKALTKLFTDFTDYLSE